MLGNFIYSKSKNLFLQELEAGNVLNEAIVFIEDTKEIWNHGIYFDGKNIDLTNYETIEESVLKLLEAKTYTDEAINSFDTKVITLKIHLKEGWNNVSFYVETDLEKLQNALGTNGILIRNDKKSSIYSNNYGWYGTLNAVSVKEMYKINVNKDCDIYLTGKLLNPNNVEIILYSNNYNYISYPLNIELPITEALVNLTPTEGDTIKNEDDIAITYTNGLWSTEFTTFIPGEGYIYKSNNSSGVAFTYPDTYYKPFGNVEISSELGESTIKAASLDLVTKVSEESKQYVDNKINNLNKVTLTIELENWKWVSFYVNITLEDLYSALGTKGLSIETCTDGTNTANLVNTYDSTTNTWSGNITELDLSLMYKILVSEALTIELTGEQLNVKEIEIALNSKYNWISYPISETNNINIINLCINPIDDDYISTQSAFAFYYEGQWQGPLESFTPGEGYIYERANVSSETFTYPTKEEILESKISSKQDKLVSGTNIKTINGTSILGSGDIVIESGSEQIQSDWNETDTTSKAYIANKPNIKQNEVGDMDIGSALQITHFLGQSWIDALFSKRIFANDYVFEIFDTNENELVKFDKNGDGTKFLAGDCKYKSISTAYPQVNHGTSDTTLALTPNVLHVWDEVAELSLILANPTDTTVANEYLFQFTSGATATTLTLPDTIKWLETPSIESDKVYLVSILNNCGTILGFV